MTIYAPEALWFEPIDNKKFKLRQIKLAINPREITWNKGEKYMLAPIYRICFIFYFDS